DSWEHLSHSMRWSLCGRYLRCGNIFAEDCYFTTWEDTWNEGLRKGHRPVCPDASLTGSMLMLVGNKLSVKFLYKNMEKVCSPHLHNQGNDGFDLCYMCKNSAASLRNAVCEIQRQSE
uniref:Uncharacterized protein n=1 Tax=Amphimedon queenslandica TaxID=400682 RepID=A0A1X7UKD5_AMPQE